MGYVQLTAIVAALTAMGSGPADASDVLQEVAGGLEAGGHVALLFSWLQLHRQVRVWGEVVGHVPDAESDEYYASRPRASQIGAWASPQSTPIADRAALDQRVAQFTETFAAVEDIPRPAFWGGWLIRPTQYEFWQGRPSRLHDRLRYRQGATGWEIGRLAP